MSLPFHPEGVIPACLLAFKSDFSIDEKWSRKHLSDLAAVEGISAITITGHAAEVHALDLDEQRRVAAFSMEEVGDRLPLVHGVYADASHQAQRIARMAREEGLSALLVIPPAPLSLGGHLRPEMLFRHFEMIAEAAGDLPIIFFQYQHHSGLHTPFETMLKLFERIPQIVAIKDWCHDGYEHERNIRTLQALERPVNVLTTHSAWLMSSLVMGCKGLLSGAGSVVADLQVQLFRAVQAGDLPLAQAVNDRLYPIQQAFYRAPFLDMHNRMKEANVLLGRLPKAIVRPPLMKISSGEIADLAEALSAAGLLKPETVHV